MRNVPLHKSEIGGNPRRRSDLSTVTGVTTILANLERIKVVTKTQFRLKWDIRYI